MSPIKTFGLALVAALSLGASAAMAQEGANDTISGATWPPPVVPGAVLRGQATQPGMVQSGSSDVQTQTTTTTGRPFWTPGVAY
jgi:acyl dehydratase